MAGALDRHRQGALLAGVAVGLAPVGDLAALVQAAAQALDVLVVDDLAGAEDWLLAAPPPTAEAAATATTAVAALRSVAATRAVTALATVAARATTGTVTAAGAVSTTIATTIATAITAGGTLGTGTEPGAGTLLAGRAGLLACLR